MTVKFSALDQAPGGPAAKTVDVNASGDRWAPAAVSLVSGDTVKWNFAAEEHFPHDVWLVAPGGNMAIPTKESEIILPGGPSVTKTLTTIGAYTFICKVHSFYDTAEGAWSGMVGTATVTAAPAGEQPSGVDFTESVTTALQGEPVHPASGRGQGQGHATDGGRQVGGLRHRHPRARHAGDRGVRRPGDRRGSAADPLLRLGL